MTGTLSISFLSEDENKLAEEAKQVALNILTDALRKKDHLLVENPGDFSNDPYYKFISPSLVRDLISELRKVTFTRGEEKGGTTAYVYPLKDERVIYLCPPFWEQSERSCAGTLIHEVCHFLGYKHTVEETMENAKKERFQHRKLLPLTAYSIPIVFDFYTNHSEPYTNGSYSCCGERVRDSVCVRSRMNDHIRKLFPSRVINDRKRTADSPLDDLEIKMKLQCVI